MSKQLTAAQQLMIEDGAPEALFLTPEQRAQSWKGRKLTQPAFPSDKKDEDPTTAAFKAELAARDKAQAKSKKAARKEAALIKKRQRDALKAAMAKAAADQQPTGEDDMSKTAKKTSAKKAAPKKPAAKKATAPKKAARANARSPAGEKTLRPGSKLEIVVGLLKRPQGCTTADVLAATNWPAVSMPQQAKAAGLTLRKEKVDGRTVYRAD